MIVTTPKLPNINYLLIVTLALLAIHCSSCSHTKDLHKTNTNTNTDSVSASVTTRTITETATTDIVIKGDTLTEEEPVVDLGEHPIDIRDDNIELKVTEDKVTHKVKATAIEKPKVIPVSINKTTTEKVIVKTDVKRDVDVQTKDLHKVVTGGFNLNWFFVVIPVCLVILLWWFFGFRRKKDPTQPPLV